MRFSHSLPIHSASSHLNFHPSSFTLLGLVVARVLVPLHAVHAYASGARTAENRYLILAANTYPYLVNTSSYLYNPPDRRGQEKA